jgi:hypothetical protein
VYIETVLLGRRKHTVSCRHWYGDVRQDCWRVTCSANGALSCEPHQADAQGRQRWQSQYVWRNGWV